MTLATIPIALQTHYDSHVHTVCYLLWVKPVSPNAEGPVGFCSKDTDIVYDNGFGPLTYRRSTGLVLSNITNTADLSVDNAEATIAIPGFSVPDISEQRINAGYFDYAEFELYEVNYKDLAAGHKVEMAGTLGRIRTSNGLICFPELRSWSQQLRQTGCTRDSRLCRNMLGDDRCGIDLTSLWVSSTVTSVESEVDRSFSSGVIAPARGFVPGIVLWTSGDNEGYENEIESFESGVITLMHPTPYAIQVGDNFDVRPDCSKVARDEVNGCKSYHGTLWGRKFNGEPDLPLGDESSLQTPGAQTSSGGGSGNYAVSPEVEQN